MKILVGTVWRSWDGRLFRVVDVQDNTIWYTNNDTKYSCTTEAFLARFFITESEK
jgi:hypothetical protein